MQFIVLSGFDRAIMALSSAPRPRKMTCHNLFITYIYVRSAYLISRQLPQKGELSDFKLPTPGVFLKLCFVVPLHMFVCDSFFFTHAAHPRRRTKTQASTRTKQGGRLEMSDEEERTCKYIEKGKCHLCYVRSLNRSNLMQPQRSSRGFCYLWVMLFLNYVLKSCRTLIRTIQF